MSKAQKIGGEIGEVRANIDVARLNGYLAEKVPTVKAPVQVKQFKVRVHPTLHYYDLTAGQFGQVRAGYSHLSSC